MRKFKVGDKVRRKLAYRESVLKDSVLDITRAFRERDGRYWFHIESKYLEYDLPADYMETQFELVPPQFKAGDRVRRKMEFREPVCRDSVLTVEDIDVKGRIHARDKRCGIRLNEEKFAEQFELVPPQPEPTQWALMDLVWMRTSRPDSAGYGAGPVNVPVATPPSSDGTFSAVNSAFLDATARLWRQPPKKEGETQAQSEESVFLPKQVQLPVDNSPKRAWLHEYASEVEPGRMMWCYADITPKYSYRTGRTRLQRNEFEWQSIKTGEKVWMLSGTRPDGGWKKTHNVRMEKVPVVETKTKPPVLEFEWYIPVIGNRWLGRGMTPSDPLSRPTGRSRTKH